MRCELYHGIFAVLQNDNFPLRIRLPPGEKIPSPRRGGVYPPASKKLAQPSWRHSPPETGTHLQRGETNNRIHSLVPLTRCTVKPPQTGGWLPTSKWKQKRLCTAGKIVFHCGIFRLRCFPDSAIFDRISQRKRAEACGNLPHASALSVRTDSQASFLLHGIQDVSEAPEKQSTTTQQSKPPPTASPTAFSGQSGTRASMPEGIRTVVKSRKAAYKGAKRIRRSTRP